MYYEIEHSVSNVLLNYSEFREVRFLCGGKASFPPAARWALGETSRKH